MSPETSTPAAARESLPPVSAAARPPVERTEPDIVCIRPRPGWQAVDVRELWRARELLFFLVWRDIKVRYKQTVLGAAWALLQPIASMVVFTVIFGKFVGIQTDQPYALFVYAGLLPWTLFSQAVSTAGISLVTNSQMLTKIYFPRLLLPAASVGGKLMDFALSFVVYFCMMPYFQYLPGPSIVLLPVLVVLTVMAAMGVGCLLASLTVTYRDFVHVLPFLVQIWMYLSPVVYPVKVVPTEYHWLLALNPMAGIIDGYRSALLNQPIDWLTLSISSGVTAAIFVFSLYYFRRTERRFADMV